MDERVLNEITKRLDVQIDGLDKRFDAVMVQLERMAANGDRDRAAIWSAISALRQEFKEDLREAEGGLRVEIDRVRMAGSTTSTSLLGISNTATAAKVRGGLLLALFLIILTASVNRGCALYDDVLQGDKTEGR